ncbi:MAG: hypothetical protein PVH82_05245 [Desulfobacteraceae bacterium]|jgi:hypothetical protein
MTHDPNKEATDAKGSRGSAPAEGDGERRLGIDRRRFSYNVHIPERRSGAERRFGAENGNGNGLRMSPKQRSDMERRATFA